MQSPKAPDNESRRRADKRRELALHTMSVLGELGFARVNLREVATRCGVQLGSNHYYFEDKTDLLLCAVQLYKLEFVGALQQLIDAAADGASLIEQGSAALGQAVADRAQMHRLWYDARAQAMFDPAFRPLVREIESELEALTARFLERLRGFGVPGVPIDTLAVYLQMDAWFRYCLQQHPSGDSGACAELVQRLRALLGPDPA